MRLRAFIVAAALFLFGLVHAQTAQLIPAPAKSTDTQNVENHSQNKNDHAPNAPALAPQVTTDENQPKAAGDTNTSKGERPWTLKWAAGLWYKFWSDPIAILTVFLVVVGGYQAWVTRDTARRQLRAYIVVKNNVAKFQQVDPHGSMTIEVTTVYINKGQTPAYDSRVVSKLRIMTPEEAEIFDFTFPILADSSVTNLGSDEPANTCVNLGRICLRPEFDEIWKATDKRLFVYGIIKYRDAFNRPRYTRFCDSFMQKDGLLKASPFKIGHKST